VAEHNADDEGPPPLPPEEDDDVEDEDDLPAAPPTPPEGSPDTSVDGGDVDDREESDWANSTGGWDEGAQASRPGTSGSEAVFREDLELRLAAVVEDGPTDSKAEKVEEGAEAAPSMEQLPALRAEDESKPTEPPSGEETSSQLPGVPDLDTSEVERTQLVEPASPSSEVRADETLHDEQLPGRSQQPEEQPAGQLQVLPQPATRPRSKPLPRKSFADPQEAYEEEERFASTPFQQAALDQLRDWDEEEEGRFTAQHVVHLTRLLVERQEELAPLPPPMRKWSDFISCDCIVWLVASILLLWAPMVVAASFARELKAQDNGVLITAFDGLPAAAVAFVDRHDFPELHTMAEATLRRIRDCAFVHRGVFHSLSVASLLRSAAGDVTITAPDRSELRIRDGIATFARLFSSEEQVDLSQATNSSAQAGCHFVSLTGAPARAQPPR